MEPAVSVESFSGLFRIMEVPFEDVRTLRADLKRRKWINFKERLKFTAVKFQNFGRQNKILSVTDKQGAFQEFLFKMAGLKSR